MIVGTFGVSAPASSCLTCVLHLASHTRYPGPGAGAGAGVGAFTAFFFALLASSVRCGPLALPCSRSTGTRQLSACDGMHCSSSLH